MSGTYTEKVRDHFISPKHLGVVAGYTGMGEVGNVICGDTVKMYIKLTDGKVEDAKYQTYGCVYSIACADMTADLVRGMSLEQAEKLTGEDVAKALDGLPETKVHCSVMAVNALRAALKNAGQNVQLLCGFKEISDDMKNAVKIPLSLQKKHRVAEMFDEFIIPELQKKGIQVELLKVDIDSHEVKFKASSSESFVKSFAEKILRKYIDDSLSLFS